MAEVKKRNVYLLHKQNQEFIRTKKGKPKIAPSPLGCLVIFFFGFIVIAGIAMGFVYQSLNVYALLAQSRDTAPAIVTNKRVEQDMESGNDYFIAYEYTIDGVVYGNDSLTSREIYNDYELGEQITITYSPTQPDVSVLNYNPTGILIVAAIFTAVFVILVLIWLLIIAAWIDYGRLQTEGQFIKGVIESSKTDTDSDGDTTLTIAYQFESPKTGKMLNKRESIDVDTHQPYGKPIAGASVLVLYLNDRLSRLL